MTIDGQVLASVSAQDGIVALGKAHTRSVPSLSSLPKVALETVPIYCLVEHRSISTLEGGKSAASFLHSSFLQAISAVMLIRTIRPTEWHIEGVSSIRGQTRRWKDDIVRASSNGMGTDRW